MQQEATMVCLNERMPFPRYFTPMDLRSMIGETCFPDGDLIVLEKGGGRVTVITCEENIPCVDELGKALLRGKVVSVRLAEKQHVHRLVTEICQFFGFSGRR